MSGATRCRVGGLPATIAASFLLHLLVGAAWLALSERASSAPAAPSPPRLEPSPVRVQLVHRAAPGAVAPLARTSALPSRPKRSRPAHPPAHPEPVEAAGAPLDQLGVNGLANQPGVTEDLPAHPEPVEGEGTPHDKLGVNGLPDKPGVTGGSATGTGDSALAALHRRLAESARRCYPSAARRFRLTGEVGLSFCLANGAVRSVELSGSTGSTLLDRAARECIVQGALPLPVSQGCYVQPVRFAPDR